MHGSILIEDWILFPSFHHLSRACLPYNTDAYSFYETECSMKWQFLLYSRKGCTICFKETLFRMLCYFQLLCWYDRNVWDKNRRWWVIKVLIVASCKVFKPFTFIINILKLHYSFARGQTYIYRLVKNDCNSDCNAMGLLQSCTKPSICSLERESSIIRPI